MTDRLERLINLVIALRETRRPMTAAQVRERVAGYDQPDAETFRRMFERDKADLRGLGVPLETQPLDRWDDRLGYRIDPRRYDLEPVALDADELAALAVAVQATGLSDDAGTALLKLQVDAGEPGLGTETDPGAPAIGVVLDAPHRDALVAAQLSRTAVRFSYRPLARDAATRTVDPFALVHRRGRWYLVGRDHDRDERRAFRLDRIEGAVRTVGEPGAFEAPPGDVGVDDVVPARGDPGAADVLASPAVAWQVARRARGGGTQAPDGWTRFVVEYRDVEDLIGWALGFGPEVEIVGPPAARAAIVADLRRLSQR